MKHSVVTTVIELAGGKLPPCPPSRWNPG